MSWQVVFGVLADAILAVFADREIDPCLKIVNGKHFPLMLTHSFTAISSSPSLRQPAP
jgi:hypothetical protein